MVFLLSTRKGLTNRKPRGLHHIAGNGAEDADAEPETETKSESEVLGMVKFRVLKRYPDGKYLLERDVNGIKREIVASDYDNVLFHINFMRHSNPTVEWVGENRKRG